VDEQKCAVIAAVTMPAGPATFISAASILNFSSARPSLQKKTHQKILMPPSWITGGGGGGGQIAASRCERQVCLRRANYATRHSPRSGKLPTSKVCRRSAWLEFLIALARPRERAFKLRLSRYCAIKVAA